MDLSEQKNRLKKANELINVISENGRHFFQCGGTVAWMEIDDRGRVWFHDSYTGKRIYTHHNGHWRGFTQGGTLRLLIICLRKFIKTGHKLSHAHFWCPDWINGGALWGYADGMEPVREAAKQLGII